MLEDVELVMGGSPLQVDVVLHPMEVDGKGEIGLTKNLLKPAGLGCWLSNPSGEGSQSLSLDAVLSLSTVLSLSIVSSELFRLKEKGLNLSRID